MISILKKYNHYLSSYFLFIAIGIVTILPFVILSAFNNPATDDFYYGYYTRRYSVYESPFWMYNNLGGRYFANTVLCISPVYFGSSYWYKIVPIILLFLFCLSLYKLIYVAFETISFQKKIALVGLLTSLFLYQLPDACSAFYWMPGSIPYQLALSLSLLTFSFLVQFYKTKKTTFFLFSILLLLFTLGCNEISVILTLLLLYFMSIYKTFIIKKTDKPLLLFVVIATLFSAIELLAPGNIVRGKAIPVKHEIFYSLTHSFTTSITFLFKWFPFIIVCCLFFVKTIYKKIETSKNKTIYIHPLLAFILLFSLLFVGFFPGFWVNHDILPDRAINTIYFYFIIGTIYLFTCILHYINELHHFSIKLTSSSKCVLGSIILIFMFSNTPIYNAYYDLINGKAYQYNLEMKHRINLIETSTSKKVIVPALTNQPKTIFKPIIMGLTTNLKDWKNQETSDYFNKDVLVKPTDSVFTE